MQKQNIPLLQEQVKKLQGLDDDTFQKLQDKTVDLPLQQIQPDMLPDTLPKGAAMLFDPIIEGDFNAAQVDSGLDGLIEDVTAPESGEEE